MLPLLLSVLSECSHEMLDISGECSNSQFAERILSERKIDAWNVFAGFLRFSHICATNYFHICQPTIFPLNIAHIADENSKSRFQFRPLLRKSS